MPGKRIVRLPTKIARFRCLRPVNSTGPSILRPNAVCARLPSLVAAIILLAVCRSGRGALPGVPQAQPPATAADTDLPIYLVRRIVILNVPPPQSNNVRVQRRIAIEHVKLEQRRQHKRKSLFTLPPTGKATHRRPLPLPPSAVRKPKVTQDPDVVSPEQRPAIAQALLTDALTDRLLDRLKVATVPDAEVRAALSELHLNPQTAASREGAMQLCSRLQAQAVLAPRITAVAIRDGVTRDCVIRATIRIPGVQLTEPLHHDIARKAIPVDTVSQETLPAQLVVAGYTQVNRVLFGSQYVQSQSDAIRLAAQQAAVLAVHTLITGQIAPFMHTGVRLAIASVPSPTQADRLVFTAQGRRVVPNAVQDLMPDVSNRFHPLLLPLLPNQIVTPKQIRARFNVSASVPTYGEKRRQNSVVGHQIGNSLWTNDDTPDIKQAQALAKALGVDYILTAHITDIELEEGPPPSEAPAIVTADTQMLGTGKQKSSLPVREREAKAEAVGALIRISDGTVLWRAHAAATMSATLASHTGLANWPTEQHIAADAVRFALVDLERQLLRYRATFEH
jgi:hypothetical protein